MGFKTYFTHRNIFLFGLVLLVVGIPLSRFLVSLSQFLLLGNWFLEGQFHRKWQQLSVSKSFWLYISIYLFFVAGLAWSDDLAYGFKDLRIKLPMLWLPVLFYTSPKLEFKHYHAVLHFFVAAVTVASFWSMIVYSGLTGVEVRDIREISRFESHIRFSLMIVLAVLYLFFVLIRKSTRRRILYVPLLAWLLIFLFILQSFTGIIILGLLGFSALTWVLFSKAHAWVKIFFSLSTLCAMLYAGGIVRDEWQKLHVKNEVDFSKLPLYTKGGRGYYHDKTTRFRENGNLVWIYIQEDEMRNEWNKRSQRRFDTVDYRGNVLRFTLVRYLASKDLPRDSSGIARLTETDVRNIENGYANYLYTSKLGLHTRMHELLWEMSELELKENPGGHSLAMRIEFWKTAWHIIRKHALLGVGTGDVEQAFKKQYADDKTILPERWQLRSHNQFLAVTVALGITGLVFFLVSFFSPWLALKKPSRFFVLFMIIQFLSFLNEDTLETQAGVTFCVFFTQYLFHHDEYNS